MDLTYTYAQLPERFYTRMDPARVDAARLIVFNAALGEELGLGLDEALPQELAEIFSGGRLPQNAQPLAMAYAGHQFGQFVPQLGDGRALLLGEIRDRNGRLRDIQLKGSGRTPYSRGGDGRAALGPVCREYLVSEAMNALGLPATRALAAVATGDAVYRQGPVPGAILTRVAASHVRVGTFQYFAARGDRDAVRQLADYVLERHFPECAAAAEPYVELLRSVMTRQAALVAGWMNVGFIHGVMNTDNMAIAGETIDFGPCAFMDEYDPEAVFSSIDSNGRYAFQNQPAAAQWNLARFAETLLPLIDADSARAVERATAVIGEFSAVFEEHWLAGMRRKLGLFTAEAGDLELARGLLAAMHAAHADFTLTFRQLSAVEDSQADGALPRAGGAGALDGAWLAAWAARRLREPQSKALRAASMRAANPCFIPRNHRIEAVIEAAVQHDDFAPFHELSRVLSRPYEDSADFAHYADAPRPEQRVTQTFCGT